MRVFGTAVLLLFLVEPSTAEIISTKIQSHNRDTILFSEFEYAHTGFVSVSVSSVGISSIPITSNSSRPDPSRIGFFLLSQELRFQYDDLKPNVCALDIKFISVLFTFQDLSPPPHSSFNKSYNVTFPGEYSLFFTNCNDLSLVTMDVRTELYNTNGNGTTKDYLSADQPQPSLYFRFFIIYLFLLLLWIEVCIRNKQHVQMLHLVMGVLLVLTLLHLFCAAVDQQDLKVTGTHHHGWHHVLFYISQFTRNVVFVGVIMVIGVGWCLWRPFLPEWAGFMLTIMALLQVWVSVSCRAVMETGPYNKDWEELKAWFVLANIINYVCVFLCIFCSSKAFKEAKDSSTFVRSFDSIKETCARPDVLSVLFMVYICLRAIPVSEETCNLLFTMVMFYMFRPFDLDNQDKKACGIWRLLKL